MLRSAPIPELPYRMLTQIKNMVSDNCAPKKDGLTPFRTPPFRFVILSITYERPNAVIPAADMSWIRSSVDMRFMVLANVQDEPRPSLARSVRLGAQSVTARVVGSSAWLGSVVFIPILVRLIFYFLCRFRRARVSRTGLQVTQPRLVRS